MHFDRRVQALAKTLRKIHAFTSDHRTLSEPTTGSYLNGSIFGWAAAWISSAS